MFIFPPSHRLSSPHFSSSLPSLPQYPRSCRLPTLFFGSSSNRSYAIVGAVYVGCCVVWMEVYVCFLWCGERCRRVSKTLFRFREIRLVCGSKNLRVPDLYRFQIVWYPVEKDRKNWDRNGSFSTVCTAARFVSDRKSALWVVHFFSCARSIAGEIGKQIHIRSQQAASPVTVTR